MALYAVVNPSTLVINMVNWDGVTPYNVSPNTLALATSQPNAQIGGTYVNGVFTAPAAPAPTPGIIFENSPVTGATLALPNPSAPDQGFRKLYAWLTPAAAIAALTIDLPPNPQDGDDIYLKSKFAITSLTLVPGAGSALLNFTSPVAIAASTGYHITYSTQLGGYFLF